MITENLNYHVKASKKKEIIFVIKNIMMYYLEIKKILLIILDLDISMDL